MCPYLKEIHPIFNSWRDRKNNKRWKQSRKDILCMISKNEGIDELLGDLDALEDMMLVSRLLNDLIDLDYLLNGRLQG